MTCVSRVPASSHRSQENIKPRLCDQFSDGQGILAALTYSKDKRRIQKMGQVLSRRQSSVGSDYGNRFQRKRFWRCRNNHQINMPKGGLTIEDMLCSRSSTPRDLYPKQKSKRNPHENGEPRFRYIHRPNEGLGYRNGPIGHALKGPNSRHLQKKPQGPRPLLRRKLYVGDGIESNTVPDRSNSPKLEFPRLTRSALQALERGEPC